MAYYFVTINYRELCTETKKKMYLNYWLISYVSILIFYLLNEDSIRIISKYLPIFIFNLLFFFVFLIALSSVEISVISSFRLFFFH